MEGASQIPVVDALVNEHGDYDLAEVLATVQQGLGLSSLRESLAVFDDKSLPARPTNIKPDEIQKLEAYLKMRQIRLEQDAVKTAADRWKKEYEQRLANGIDSGQSFTLAGHCHRFHEALMDKLQEEKDLAAAHATQDPKTLNAEERERLEMSPFLDILPVERLSYLTVSTVLSLIQRTKSQAGIKVGSLVVGLGKAVAEDSIETAALDDYVEVEKAAGTTARNAKSARRLLARQMMQNRNLRRHYIRKHAKNGGTYVDVPAWPATIHAKLGSHLTKYLVDTAKIERFRPTAEGEVKYLEPVFRHQYRFEGGKKVGVIVLNEEFSKVIISAPPGHLLAKHLPMLAPPKSWRGIIDGAFYSYKVPVLRYKDQDLEQRRYCEAAAEKGDLEQVFAALDVLGRTPWRINENILKVMVEVWNTGEQFADIAPADPGLSEPEKPADYKESRRSRAQYWAEVRKNQNMRTSLHSQRCFQNFQLEVARSYRNEVFYLPHSIDFRGRAYPLPPYLNQMGADNSRGLLLFGKGRALGASGLRWLRIHLANVFGFDKASLSEREQFAKDHMADVTDSATKPLEGNRWWLKAEDPWQCLATCFELHAAMTSPDPLAFQSRLPVHQDGSCNGLQHYAALGGDTRGAAQVNLMPSDRPSDVYTAVAEIVKEGVARDAEAGNRHALFLNGRITRKIVKQTVMTNVYGVTFLGATRQVKRQLVDALPADVQRHPEFRMLNACAYVARHIFGALGELFSGAHDIQYWLGSCASRITQSLAPEQVDQIAEGTSPIAYKAPKKPYDPSEVFKSTVIWTTPLKLPVVQPYKKLGSKRVTSSLQGGVFVLQQTGNDPVNQRKQLQAFPPNFIHSLDACHMALSAVACDKKGLTFSAVHDSFWTHAGDIDEMNTILRDAFIRMHSEDVIGRLAAEFNARYSRHLYLASLTGGNPVSKALEAWRAETHGSSMTRAQIRTAELLLERKRQKMLDSDDPAERAEGAKMVTPASIYAAGTKDDSLLYDITHRIQKPLAHIPSQSEIEQDLKTLANDDDVLMEATNVDSLDDPLDNMSDDAADAAAEAKDDSAKGRKGQGRWATFYKKNQMTIHNLWLPVRFPPVPKRGEFKVTETRNSKYFFS